MVDRAPLGAHGTLEGDNHFNTGSFDGWSVTDDTNAVNTYYRGSMYLKGTTGAKLDLVATDPTGTIWSSCRAAADATR